MPLHCVVGRRDRKSRMAPAPASPIKLTVIAVDRHDMTIIRPAAIDGKAIFPRSPAKLYVPSAPRERCPEYAAATSVDAIGCCVLDPMPPITSATASMAQLVLRPRPKYAIAATAVPAASILAPPSHCVILAVGTCNPAIAPA